MVKRAYFDDLAQVRAEIVDPVVNGLLRPEELDSVELLWVSDPYAGSGGDVLHVLVNARGERMSQAIWSPDWGLATKKEMRAALAVTVEDFIAESRFAWGEQRTYVDAETGLETDTPH